MNQEKKIEDYCCPITGQIIVHPIVFKGQEDQVFEEAAIRQYILENGTNPLNRQIVTEDDLKPFINEKKIEFRQELIKFLQNNLEDRKNAWITLFMLDPHKQRSKEETELNKTQLSILVQSGAPIDEPGDQTKETALDIAILNDDEGLISVLLEAKAKITQETKFYARYINNAEVIKKVGECDEKEFAKWLQGQRNLADLTLKRLVKAPVLTDQDMNTLAGLKVIEGLGIEVFVTVITARGMAKEMRLLLDNSENKPLLLSYSMLHFFWGRERDYQTKKLLQSKDYDFLISQLKDISTEKDADKYIFMILNNLRSINNWCDCHDKMIIELMHAGIDPSKCFDFEGGTSIFDILIAQSRVDLIAEFINKKEEVVKLLSYLIKHNWRKNQEEVISQLIKKYSLIEEFGDSSVLQLLVSKGEVVKIADFFKICEKEEDKQKAIKQIFLQLADQKGWGKEQLFLWKLYVFPYSEYRTKNLALLFDSIHHLSKEEQSQILKTLIADKVLPENTYGHNNGCILDLLLETSNDEVVIDIVQNAKKDEIRIQKITDKIVNYWVTKLCSFNFSLIKNFKLLQKLGKDEYDERILQTQEKSVKFLEILPLTVYGKDSYSIVYLAAFLGSNKLVSKIFQDTMQENNEEIKSSVIAEILLGLRDLPYGSWTSEYDAILQGLINNKIFVGKEYHIKNESISLLQILLLEEKTDELIKILKEIKSINEIQYNFTINKLLSFCWNHISSGFPFLPDKWLHFFNKKLIDSLVALLSPEESFNNMSLIRVLCKDCNAKKIVNIFELITESKNERRKINAAKEVFLGLMEKMTAHSRSKILQSLLAFNNNDSMTIFIKQPDPDETDYDEDIEDLQNIKKELLQRLPEEICYTLRAVLTHANDPLLQFAVEHLIFKLSEHYTIDVLEDVQWREPLHKIVELLLKELKFTMSEKFSKLEDEKKEQIKVILQNYLDKRPKNLLIDIVKSENKQTDNKEDSPGNLMLSH